MQKKKITKKKILTTAKKFKTIKDFSENYYNIYRASLDFGTSFHKKATSHMHYALQKWTPEKIIADARKYKRKMEWARNSPNAYTASYKLNINKKASKHFEKVGSYVERCIYSISIRNKKIIYIGLTYDFQRRIKDHFKSKRIKRLIRLYKREKIISKQLTKYLPTEKAKKLEEKFINIFKKKRIFNFKCR